MVSSYEIAQLHGQQMSMLSQQQAYAQQIGVDAPPQMPQFMVPPAPYAPRYNPITDPSMQAGTQMAGTAAGIISGTKEAIGTGIGIAGFFGKAGALQYTDPFSVAQVGYNAARAANMSRLAAGYAGLGVGAAAAVPIGLASQALESYVGGMTKQAGTSTMLEQNFQQFNPRARGGKGFTRDDAETIGAAIRSIANLPEMLTSVEELNAMVPKLKQMGVFSGIKDSKEMSRVMKESFVTMREISKLIGTTMEEATKFFEESRSVGMLGRTDQLRNLMAVNYTAANVGADRGQIVASQQQGAQLSRAMGGRSAAGAMMATSTVNALQGAMEQGGLREGLLLDYTGQEGPQGILSAANRLNQAMSQSLMSEDFAPGTAMLYGAMKRNKDGSVTLDADIIRRMKNGQVTPQEIIRRGQSKSNEDKLAFKNRRGELVPQFIAAAGPGAYYKFMEAALGEGASPEKIERAMQMQGFTSQDVEISRGMAGALDKQGLQQREFQNIQISEARIKDTKTLGEALGMWWERGKVGMFSGLEERGASAATEIGRLSDRFADKRSGRIVTSGSLSGVSEITRAIAGGGGEYEKLLGLGGGGLAASATLDDERIKSRLLSESLLGPGYQRFKKSLEGTTTSDSALMSLKKAVSDMGLRGEGIGEAQFNEATRRASSLRNLAREGKGGFNEDLRAEVESVVEQLGDTFTGASPELRRELLKQELNRKRIYGVDKSNLAEQLRNTEQFKGIDVIDALVEGYGSEYTGFSLEGSRLAALQTLDVKDIANMQKKAEDVASKFGATSRAFITGGGSKAVKAATKDKTTRNQVRRIMLSQRTSPEEKAEKLSEILGTTIRPGDLEGLSSAIKEVEGSPRMMKSLEEYEELSAKVDFGNLGIGLREAAAGIEDEGVSSLSDVKKALELTSRTGRFEGLTEATEKYVSDVMSAKTEEDRQKLLSKGGDVGTALGDVLSGASKIKGKKAKAGDIAKAFGLDPESDAVKKILASEDISDKKAGKLSEGGFRKFAALATTVREAEFASKQVKTAPVQEDKMDKDLKTTLSSLNSTLSQMNTILPTLAPQDVNAKINRQKNPPIETHR